jgi:hypothetical protein
MRGRRACAWAAGLLRARRSALPGGSPLLQAPWAEYARPWSCWQPPCQSLARTKSYSASGSCGGGSRMHGLARQFGDRPAGRFRSVCRPLWRATRVNKPPQDPGHALLRRCACGHVRQLAYMEGQRWEDAVVISALHAAMEVPAPDRPLMPASVGVDACCQLCAELENMCSSSTKAVCDSSANSRRSGPLQERWRGAPVPAVCDRGFGSVGCTLGVTAIRR